MKVVHSVFTTALPLATKILIAGVLFVTLYNATSFSASTESAVNHSFSSDADVNLYGLVDDLSDPAAFSAFRESVPALNRLRTFYNDLAADRDLNFLSTFDQPVPVRDFRGGPSFEDGYGTELSTRGAYKDEGSGYEVFDAKSVQINRNAFEFYSLETSSGRPFSWKAVDYDGPSTPVLLGDDYRGVYDIGDTFVGNLYFKETTFEVIGFLAPDSSIFYHDDINFFLDSHIVIPYPERLDDVNEADKAFAGILSFAMINGDVTAPKGLSSNDVIQRLAALSRLSGFDDYTLLNVSPYLTQFTLTRQVIQSNRALVTALECALSIGSLFALHALNRQVFASRSRRDRIAWRVGTSRRRLAARSAAVVLSTHAAIALVLFVAYRSLPQHSEPSLQPVVLAFVGLLVLDLAHHAALLARLIRSESGKGH